jgi:glycerol-3-phosphate acyltransferase PlsY
MGILVIVLGYLLGAPPFGYLIPRWIKGVDIRSLGTGNPGTANVFRTVGLAGCDTCGRAGHRQRGSAGASGASG